MKHVKQKNYLLCNFSFCNCVSFFNILYTDTYTPNTKKITFSDLSKLVSYYEAQFINTDENGKEFTLTIPKAYSIENLQLGFVSDDAVDETMKVPIKLTAFPDDNNIMLHIEDEQSVV